MRADPDPPAGPVLAALVVSGDAAPWVAAGFEADESGGIVVGSVLVRPTGRPEPAGVVAWHLTDVEDGVVDGLLTLAHDGPLPSPGTHPNTALSVDHVVVTSPDLDRTTTALAGFGIGLRRTRDAGAMEQRFFRLGRPVLELVGPPGGHGPGPATFWGLALTVADLDRAAAVLGDGLGPAKDAVQPGRRIATVRHEALGLPVPVALLTPRPEPPAP